MPFKMPGLAVYTLLVNNGTQTRPPDEFDVFMDSVNRRISMKMMACPLCDHSYETSLNHYQVDTANTSDKQYILITPQDMSHVALGPTVRVHRMSKSYSLTKPYNL